MKVTELDFAQVNNFSILKTTTPLADSRKVNILHQLIGCTERTSALLPRIKAILICPYEDRLVAVRVYRSVESSERNVRPTCHPAQEVHPLLPPDWSEIKPAINNPGVVCCLCLSCCLLSGDVTVAYLGLGTLLCFHKISKHLHPRYDFETRGTL